MRKRQEHRRIRTRQPVLPRSKVRSRGNLAALESLDGTARGHDNTQTGRTANGFLTGGNDTVNTPLVKLDLFAANTAHTVNNNQRVGADLVHKLAESLDLAEHSGRRVDVGDGDELVLLLLESLLDLIQLGTVANGSLDLGGPDAVCLETVGKAVGKVTSV